MNRHQYALSGGSNILNVTALEHEYLSWDWKTTDEELQCQYSHESAISMHEADIPRVVHFIMLSPEGESAELDLAQFMAIKSAVYHIQPTTTYLHTTLLNGENQRWQKLRHRVNLSIHKRPLRHHSDYAGGHLHNLSLYHQADMLRLDVLRRQGGIYLDTDVYVLRPVTSLLKSPRNVVMGYEGGNRSGLCNAVIVSRPESAFLAKWQASYESFDKTAWNQHSVRVPARLARLFPNLICTLSPSAFFWPTWGLDHIEYMPEELSPQEIAEFETTLSQNKGAMYEHQLAYHAWGSMARARYLSKFDPDALFSHDSRFNILLRSIYLAAV